MSVPNIEKLFQYLQCFSIEPIEYCSSLTDFTDNKIITIGDKITDIRLNYAFFYNDNCQMCGGCDPAESNIFTSSEYEQIKACQDEIFIEAGLDPAYLHQLKENLYKSTCVINGKEVSIYIYKQEPNELFLPTRGKIIKRCSWCFQDSEKRFKCRIHPVESITCIMPHLRTYHFKGSNKASLGVTQFGRNWALKCPVELTPPKNKDQFEYNKSNRIAKLERLHQVGLDLNIPTYLPQVIDYVKNTHFTDYESRLDVNVLSKKQRSLF